MPFSLFVHHHPISLLRRLDLNFHRLKNLHQDIRRSNGINRKKCLNVKFLYSLARIIHEARLNAVKSALKGLILQHLSEQWDCSQSEQCVSIPRSDE